MSLTDEQLKYFTDDDPHGLLDADKSIYTEGNTVIAFNQSNYPTLIEVYDVNEDYITFASNINKLETCNKVKYESSTGRAYFQHYGQKYYLDECINVGL